VAIIRDWSRRDAALKESYPDAPIKTIPIQLWPYEMRESFIRERLIKHSEAEFQFDTGDDLTQCNADEMWEKPTTYAVKKKGGVKARNVCSTLEEANSKLAEYGKDYEVEVRPGERTRCKTFCQVSRFCDQYQSYLAQGEVE